MSQRVLSSRETTTTSRVPQSPSCANVEKRRVSSGRRGTQPPVSRRTPFRALEDQGIKEKAKRISGEIDEHSEDTKSKGSKSRALPQLPEDLITRTCRLFDKYKDENHILDHGASGVIRLVRSGDGLVFAAKTITLMPQVLRVGFEGAARCQNSSEEALQVSPPLPSRTNDRDHPLHSRYRAFDRIELITTM
eukprot:2953111-Pyramimonas_sp.AAC.1